MHRPRTLLIATAAAALAAGTLFTPQAATAALAAGGQHRTPAKPGTVVRSQELPRSWWVEGTGKAYKIWYVSRGEQGAADVVSGLVYLPEGKAPRHGWKTVSWAHGTVGIADRCAPSDNAPTARTHQLFSAWLKRGWAVVATDYEGLGTAGTHTYLNGVSQAHAAIDIVRAARSLTHRKVGRSWAVYGHSQGGQTALFTGDIAPSYAPDLDFRGSVAAAPPSHWKEMGEALGQSDPAAQANPYYALLIAGLVPSEPTLNPADYLKPKGMEIYDVAVNKGCFADIFAAGAGVTNADFRYDQPLNGDTDGLFPEIAAHADIPVAAYRKPVYIVQGTSDSTVSYQATRMTVDDLTKAGTKVTYKEYEGVEHAPLPQTAQQDVDGYLSTLLGR
jgi:alpha-beta hydrolase superfamily lysophospholipase